jgi:hypothetical protein
MVELSPYTRQVPGSSPGTCTLKILSWVMSRPWVFKNSKNFYKKLVVGYAVFQIRLVLFCPVLFNTFLHQIYAKILYTRGAISCIMTRMKESKKNYFKFILILVLCLLARLFPFRAPNVEPILAATMPMGRAYGVFAGFSFALLSILLYDALTGTIGLQTFFTAGAYGIIGLGSAYYFKKYQADKWSYMRLAIIGTLFFDAVTGLTVGPIFFHQSFLGSLVRQIPFTALHLIGNMVFAFALSPGLYNFLIKKKKEKTAPIINPLNPKII